MFKNLNPATLGISSREREVIELALSAGFKGLDLDLVDFAQEAKTATYERAARSIVSARLKIGSFELPLRWQHDNADYRADLEGLPALAELAARLGCTRATTLIEPASDERRYHENFEFHRRRLAEVAQALAPHKIRLGVGFLAPTACRANLNFQFMQKADEVLLLLQSIAAPGIGLALDSWHWHLGGGTVAAIKGLGAEKIVTVAVADADPTLTAADAKLSDRRMPADGGAVDNAGLLAALAELRYDGPVTPSPDQSRLGGLGRDKIIKQACAALDAVWKAAGLNPAGKLATVMGR